MSQKVLLLAVCAYLLGVPLVTSLNGLSIFFTGISSVGPLYHAGFSLFMIFLGLTNRRLRKNWLLIGTTFGLFTFLVLVQILLGYSDLALFDLGQLYKWFMPILLFVIFYRWHYLAEPGAQRLLISVFQNVPFIYSILVLLSAVTFFFFHFNPTLLPAGSLRFTGFSYGYNTTINSFFIAAYVNFILIPVSNRRKLYYGLAFIGLNSKSAIAYYALIGWSFFAGWWQRVNRLRRVGILILASPVLVLFFWFGYNRTIRAVDSYGFYAKQGSVVDSDVLFQHISDSRFTLWKYAMQDIPQWPIENIFLGNGKNIDRRVVSSLWWDLYGSRWFSNLEINKSTKGVELDLLGHLDLFGVLGTLWFVGIFYIYPLLKIRLPYSRLYFFFLILLSLFSGHVINNPQTATLLVFLILFLRNYRPSRMEMAQPAKYKTIDLLNRAALGKG